MDNPSVSIIGSGNLAYHLAKAMHNQGIIIRQIYGRNHMQASLLATQVNACAVSDFSALHPVDVLFVCVTDSAIFEVSKSLVNWPNLLVHTSGSTAMHILDGHPNIGVFYPFQTFTKEVKVSFKKVPIFIEANKKENLNLLHKIASAISAQVQELDSEQRLKLHLAAVFASNFTNHMYAISKQLLNDSGLSFDLIKHLIEETTRKVLHSGDPVRMQTGPACRENISIMGLHKELLVDKSLWQKIYTFVSDSIIEMQKGQ